MKSNWLENSFGRIHKGWTLQISVVMNWIRGSHSERLIPLSVLRGLGGLRVRKYAAAVLVVEWQPTLPSANLRWRRVRRWTWSWARRRRWRRGINGQLGDCSGLICKIQIVWSNIFFTHQNIDFQSVNGMRINLTLELHHHHHHYFLTHLIHCFEIKRQISPSQS